MRVFLEQWSIAFIIFSSGHWPLSSKCKVASHCQHWSYLLSHCLVSVVCPEHYLWFTVFFLWENVFCQATDFPRKMMEYIPFVSWGLSFCQGYHLNMNRLQGFYTNLTFPIPTLLFCLWSPVSRDSAPILTILGCRDYQMQQYNFFKGKLFSYNV